MKKILYLCLLIAGLGLSSCQKEGIDRYKQRAGVYFSTYETNFSFSSELGIDSKVLRLPVDITGLPEDRDREFIIDLPHVDTITTAEEDQYRIGKGLVKAGEGKGFAEVEVFKDDRLKDSTYVLRLEIRKSPDFPEIRLSRTIMTVSFSNKLIKPENWSYLGLGDYSTAWWTFVLEVTEGNTLPFWTGGPGGTLNPDPEKWYMTYGELGAWQAKIRRELDKYNADHPDDPLRHDDGNKRGEPVEMPS